MGLHSSQPTSEAYATISFCGFGFDSRVLRLNAEAEQPLLLLLYFERLQLRSAL